MDSVLEQIGEWLKELLVSAIMNQLTGLFDSVNTQVGDIATQVGTTPANFSPGVFAMIRNVSESVIIPIAGLILTFIACYELIQMIIDHNNLANFETWIFFKWVFKTFVAVTLITNTFNIVRAVFDVTQHVINHAGGLIAGSTAVDASALETMQETLEAMELGAAVRAVPAVYGRSVHHQGTQCSDLRDRLWTNDRDLPDDQYGTDPVLHLRKPGTEYGGAELSPISVCSRVSGIPDHDLRRHLCGADPEHFRFG